MHRYRHNSADNAGRWKKRATHRARNDLERCHVPNHLAPRAYPCPSRLYLFFLFFFFFSLLRPPFRRSLPLTCLVAALLSPVPREPRDESRFIELFNTGRRARTRAPILMDRRKGTHNGRTNRDSTTALTTERETFSRYFCAADRGEETRLPLREMRNIHLSSSL